jgi:hypothetical protein
VANEKCSVDRRRFEALGALFDVDFQKIIPQLLDFDRNFLSPISTKDPKNHSKIYLTSKLGCCSNSLGKSQANIYRCLFLEDKELLAYFEDMLEVTDGYEKKDKCVQDVLELENLMNLWLCILFI